MRIDGYSCPCCGSGVMETVGYLELKSGPINFVFSCSIPDPVSTTTIQMLICSLDDCGYTHMRAAPGSLSHAKHELRKKRYREAAVSRLS